MNIHAPFPYDSCKHWPLDGDVALHFQRTVFFTLPEEHSPHSLSSPGSEHQKAAQREEKCILHQMAHAETSQSQHNVTFQSSTHTHKHSLLNTRHLVRLHKK